MAVLGAVSVEGGHVVGVDPRTVSPPPGEGVGGYWVQETM